MSDPVISQTPAPGQASEHSPSPELFFRTANAYQQTAALKGAVDLGVFTAIAEGHQTAAEIARACGASERGVRILCDYLCVSGFLTKATERYNLTPDSAVFLNRHSPAYIGGTLDFILSPHVTDHFTDVAAIVRHGGSLQPHGANLAPEHPAWVTFARAMRPMMMMPAQLMAQLVNGSSAQPLKVLDIAAGHGAFGVAFSRLNPNAQIVAQDWANVLQVAVENAHAAGVADRYSTIPGSAFDVDFGSDYDVVLLTNFLHHFDPATCDHLLKKVHAALVEGGRAVTLDFIPNHDRVSPPVAASFAMTMLGTTPSGDTYTFAELETMCASAGFDRSELRHLTPTPQQVVISYK
jgi:2-polyprenyl-3-methyl-5-hydroxy-6-metoxy-1,4-benzoquinol methylase